MRGEICQRLRYHHASIHFSAVRAPIGIGPPRSCAPSCYLRAWQSCEAWCVCAPRALWRQPLQSRRKIKKRCVAREYWGTWGYGQIKLGGREVRRVATVRFTARFTAPASSKYVFHKSPKGSLPAVVALAITRHAFIGPVDAHV